jgi:hypothetical protein
MKYHQKKYGKEYTISGSFSQHTAEIQHTGLKETKVLKDKDKNTLETKISNQFKRWDLKFEKEEGCKNAKLETQKAGYSGDIVPLIPGILCHKKQM